VGDRVVNLYHTSADVVSFFADERKRFDDLVFYGTEDAVTVPVVLPFTELSSRRAFLVSREAFASRLLYRGRDSEKSHVDEFNSEVVRVSVSRVSPALFTRGSYWLTTNNIVDRIEKSSEFLAWSAALYRRLRSRCRRIETVHGYYDWCMHDAYSWLQQHAGVFKNTGEFWILNQEQSEEPS